ncbi:MAG: hypothetical protein D6731_13365 [Planctomycetota bacterium]|nr:MAG: hypothetical protein D6731_13365 [Planctomycetota bacterium]
MLAAGLRRRAACEASGLDPFDGRLHAAILHSRRPVRFEDLFDAEALARRRGPESVPALGEALLEALERTVGEGARARLFAALAGLPRAPAPRSSSGRARRWSELLGALGIERADLEERFFALIEDDVPEDPRAALALPRLDVLVRMQASPAGWRVVVVPDQEVPAGWDVECRLRGRGIPSGSARRLGAQPDGSYAFFVLARNFLFPPEVQVGLRCFAERPLLQFVWEDWQAPRGAP